MSQINPPSVQIEFTPEFKRNVRELAKRYRHIQNDLQPIIEQLQRGQILGVQITGVRYALYKLRVRNSDNRKGKSGGYRLIYYLRTTERLILVTIYSKSDQGDISKKRLASILNEFTQSQTIE